MIGLEFKKNKHSGLFPTFVVGGILAALIPILNMAVRSEIFIHLEMSPVEILLKENWQMMGMLNVLLITVGACLLYNIEYADNAIQKMNTLPIKEIHLYFSKAILVTLLCVVVLLIEAAAISFCTWHWFQLFQEIILDIVKHFLYSLLLLLPVIAIALLIASACKNMWISLGIGVICVFTASILPTKQFVFSLFPFALPFQMFTGTTEDTLRNYMIAAVCEIAVFGIAEALFLKIRRSLE